MLQLAVYEGFPAHLKLVIAAGLTRVTRLPGLPGTVQVLNLVSHVPADFTAPLFVMQGPSKVFFFFLLTTRYTW